MVVIDADLQDPPEELLPFIQKIRDGWDVVYAIRTKRKENVVKRICYQTYYQILKRLAVMDIPLDAGDFCVMKGEVVDAINRLPERNRFVRGLRSWVGFRQTGIAYERQARFAGEPKYTYRKLFRLSPRWHYQLQLPAATIHHVDGTGAGLCLHAGRGFRGIPICD